MGSFDDLEAKYLSSQTGAFDDLKAKYLDAQPPKPEVADLSQGWKRGWRNYRN